ncbi:MAG: DNA-binding response regulator, partial [Polyangiaceae bacterium UTPRO1]
MKRVLVVDDERKMRRVLQMLLEQMGLESTAAESGEEALVLFRQEKFDLVMTDLRMPGMGGMAWIEHLRQLDAEVPVIVLTAYGTVQTAVEAMK